MNCSHIQKPYKKWNIHSTKMNYSYIYIYIYKTWVIHIYIKKGLFIQRSYSYKKKELFIYKKKFLVIIIYKKVSCTKMLYILQKMSFSYKKIVIHTKKEVIHTKNGLFIHKKWVIHTKKILHTNIKLFIYIYQQWVMHTKNELFI